MFLKITVEREGLETAKRAKLVTVADDAFRLLVVEIGVADDLLEGGGIDFAFHEGGGGFHFYLFLQIGWQTLYFVQLSRADETAHPFAVFADAFGVE